MDISASLQDIVKSAKSADSAIKQVNDALNNSKDVFTSVTGVTGHLADSISGLGDAFKEIPGLGDSILGTLFSAITNGAAAPLRIIENLGYLINEFINITDNTTQPIRALDSELYSLAAGFGFSFKEAQKLREEIIKLSKDAAEGKFGSFNMKELREAASALTNSGLNIEYLGESVDGAGYSLNILNAALLQSKSLGISVDEYFKSMNTSIRLQGLSTKAAAQQLSNFSEISKETKLNVSEVSNALENMSNKFSIFGVTTSFGEPILKGFSRSLQNMGLGIENAIDLSSELSNSILSLTTDYSKAYLTFTRGGGFNFGGGALSGSIQLQKKLLDAQKAAREGDTTKESALAKEIALAIRGTIQNLTGSRLIDINEAASSENLTNIFYQQSSLLGQLYNISEANAGRTIEMLKSIDKIDTASLSDLDGVLGRQLQDAVDSRVQTLSGQEKVDAAMTSAIFEEYQKSYSVFIEKNIEFQGAVVDNTKYVAEKFSEYNKEFAENYGSIVDAMKVTMETSKNVTENLEYLGQQLVEAVDGDDDYGDLAKIITQAIEQGNQPIRETLSMFKDWITSQEM